jgi:A49-like RNA polymerase I associated factor
MAKLGAARAVPRHNPSATKPHEAYRLTDMFPSALMSALNVGQLLHAVEKPEDAAKLADRGAVRTRGSSRHRHCCHAHWCHMRHMRLTVPIHLPWRHAQQVPGYVIGRLQLLHDAAQPAQRKLCARKLALLAALLQLAAARSQLALKPPRPAKVCSSRSRS